MKSASRLMFCAIICCVILGHAAPAQAQLVAGGSFFASWQPAPTDYLFDSLHDMGVGGSGIGVGVLGGGLITPRIGVRVELSIPSGFDGVQDTGIVRTQLTHRDVVVSGVASFKTVTHGPELIGGLAFVSEQTDEILQTRNHDGFLGVIGTDTKRHPTWGLTGGIDFPIQLARSNVFLTPQLRVHWISRLGIGGGTDGVRGLSSIVLRPAIAVTIQFQEERSSPVR